MVFRYFFQVAKMSENVYEHEIRGLKSNYKKIGKRFGTGWSRTLVLLITAQAPNPLRHLAAAARPFGSHFELRAKHKSVATLVHRCPQQFLKTDSGSAWPSPYSHKVAVPNSTATKYASLVSCPV